MITPEAELIAAIWSPERTPETIVSAVARYRLAITGQGAKKPEPREPAQPVNTGTLLLVLDGRICEWQDSEAEGADAVLAELLLLKRTLQGAT